jgi:flavin reductase (DIM6/NTAB) family NADH-FMN oxidoreductase RutF
VAVEDTEFPPTAPVSTTEFRRVVGHFATGIAIAATTDRGIDHAMTVSAFTSVSLDPLLVLICVEKTARFHQAVSNSGAWALSILAEDAEATSRWFAEKGRPTQAQFAGFPRYPGPATGMPVLDGAIAVVECRTWSWHDGGDHDILLGSVVGVWAAEPPRGPLLYLRGSYRRLAD